MGRGQVLTALGVDGDVLCARDREGILFDLGLDILHIDACVRSSDPGLITALRSRTGKMGLRDQMGKARPFRQASHAAFQALLGQYGLPEQLTSKRHIVDSIMAGEGPEAVRLPDDRRARATIRVALRQLRATEHPSAALTAWLSTYDRRDPVDAEDPMQASH